MEYPDQDTEETPRLTFAQVNQMNRSRRNAWHDEGEEPWTIADWSNAMAGEAGEVCNAVKKLRRIETKIRSINKPGRQIDTREQAVAKIAEELADTMLYLDLIAIELDIDLARAVVDKFNSVSVEYGFPHRLRGA